MHHRTGFNNCEVIFKSDSYTASDVLDVRPDFDENRVKLRTRLNRLCKIAVAVILASSFKNCQRNLFSLSELLKQRHDLSLQHLYPDYRYKSSRLDT